MLNVFRPSAEIFDPHEFAGRKKQIENLVDELLSDGSVPILYGDRGLGKSSIALQIERIALGDVQLLSELKLKNRALPERDRYVTIYLACSEIMKTCRALFQSIVNNAEGYSSLQEIAESRQADSYEIERRLKLRIYESSTKSSYTSSGGPSYSKLTIDEKLHAVLESVHRKFKKPVLVILDEIDRIRDTNGLGGFLKNNNKGWLKFLLVGVGENISSLIADHNSIDRKAVPLPVEKMESWERVQILEYAEQALAESNVNIRFDDLAKDIISLKSDGFPWFVHLLGRESLLAAWDEERDLVMADDVFTAITGLAKNRFAQQFSDTYTKAVGDSIHREILLRLMARWRGDNVPTQDIYRAAKKMGLSNPSQCAKQLTQEKYGGTMIRNPEPLKNVTRFRNAMFKQYINLRQSIYENVDERIEKVW